MNIKCMLFWFSALKYSIASSFRIVRRMFIHEFLLTVASICVMSCMVKLLQQFIHCWEQINYCHTNNCSYIPLLGFLLNSLVPCMMEYYHPAPLRVWWYLITISNAISLPPPPVECCLIERLMAECNRPVWNNVLLSTVPGISAHLGLYRVLERSIVIALGCY